MPIIEAGRKMENIKRLRMTLLTVLIFLMMVGVTFLFIKRQMGTIPRFHSYTATLTEPLTEKPKPSIAAVTKETETTGTVAKASEPAVEQTNSVLPDEISRFVVDKHTVEWGECFSLITGDYWGDMFLWPDLYMLNDMKSGDPDLIYPNEVIEIFNRLGQGDTYTGRERETILQAYIDVYRIYKSLGDKKNNSAWSVLWCAAKYDENFLTNYGDQIDPADRAMAQKYINEKGIIE
jgi:hypothetical protein